jgi:hypothetical protein
VLVAKAIQIAVQICDALLHRRSFSLEIPALLGQLVAVLGELLLRRGTLCCQLLNRGCADLLVELRSGGCDRRRQMESRRQCLVVLLEQRVDRVRRTRAEDLAHAVDGRPFAAGKQLVGGPGDIGQSDSGAHVSVSRFSKCR